MVGVYDYTVILTYLSAVLALLGSGLALSGNFTAGIVCLVLCGICDMFDGQVARTKKGRTQEEKSFGIQIDSLCDLIAFGVFPSILGYSLSPVLSWEKLFFVLLPLAGLIRLAYYNVQEENRQKQTEEKRKYFTGLPITSSAVAFPLLTLFSDVIPGNVFYILYLCLVILLTALFVAKIKVPKPSKPVVTLAVVGAIFAVIRVFLWIVA